MATYTVTHKTRLDDYAVLQVLTPPDLGDGATITVAGVDATFNGTWVVRDVPQYEFVGVDTQGDLLFNYAVAIPNQILFANVGDPVERQAAAGTVTYAPVCTWVSAADVTAWLNITVASANDTALVTQAAAAASQFAYRRRAQASYTDSLTTVPSADVKLGTTMLAGAYYRMRGSLGDTFATFDGMGAMPMPGLTGPIKQLLGIDRPAIA